MRWLSCFVVLIVVACEPEPRSVASDDASGGESVESFVALSQCTIAGLKNLYIDDSHRINDVVYVVGSITANDLFGEYPDTLVIEDDSGAIRVSVDLEDDLYLYGIGTQITLYCTDLWMGSYGGTIVLGAEPTGDSVVDALALEDFERKLLGVEYDCEVRDPQMVTIGGLTTQHISCFVGILGVEFVDADSATHFCAYDEELSRRVTTLHTLRDGAGDEITLYVPSTVAYADDLVPTGEVTIYAIVDSYGGSYSVTLVEGRVYD